MAYQSREWKDMAGRLLRDVDMIIYGDGLISYMTEVAAAEAQAAGLDVEDVEIEGDGQMCYAPLDRRGNLDSM